MKNKRIYSFLMVVVIIFNMFLSTGGIVNATVMKGLGTEASPYLIRTVEDLYSIPDNPEAHYKLINDLDLKNVERTPMPDFKGVLDGNGHSIYNLKINSTDYTYRAVATGLFRYLDHATVKNIAFSNCQISAATKWVATIAGGSWGSLISQCSVKNSSINGKNATGGLIGVAISPGNNTIENCYVENTTISVTDAYDTGGIMGNQGQDHITNCYFSGTITLGAYGISWNSNKTTNSYFDQQITGIE